MEDRVFLAQSDTTVGFLSKSSEKISKIKQRPKNKSFIITVANLKTLQNFVRVEKRYKKEVRRAKKTTFIYKNLAIRVIKDKEHLNFLSKMKWCYSSSANLSSQLYDKEFAMKNVQIIVEDRRGLSEGRASKILKIRKAKIKRVR